MQNDPQPPARSDDTWDLDDLELEDEDPTESTFSVDQLWTTACDEDQEEDGEEPWLDPDDDTLEIPGKEPANEELPTSAVERGPALPTWYPEFEIGVNDLPVSALSPIN